MSRRTWTVIRFAIAIAIIAFLVAKINLRDVADAISSARPGYVAAALVLTVVSWTVSSYRLKFFSALQGLTVTTFQAFEINLSTIFYGLFLPGGNLTGGIIKFYKLSRKDKMLSEAFIALALERVFATLALCLVGVFFWFLSVPGESGSLLLSMLAILLLLAAFCAAVFLDRRHRVINFMLGLANRVYRSEKLNRFTQSLSGLGKISYPYFIIMTGLSIATQLINVLVFFILLRSMDLLVPFSSIGWIRSVVVLVTMIPISISGMGLREGTFIFLLGAYGLSDSSAFAYSLLVFAVTRVFTGALGGLFEVRGLLAGGTQG